MSSSADSSGSFRCLTKKATQRAPASASQSAPSADPALPAVSLNFRGRLPLLSDVAWIRTTPPDLPTRFTASDDKNGINWTFKSYMLILQEHYILKSWVTFNEDEMKNCFECVLRRNLNRHHFSNLTTLTDVTFSSLLPSAKVHWSLDKKQKMFRWWRKKKEFIDVKSLL